MPADTAFVAFGGSYSGALAGWLRLKYPSHVIASVATSSPVEAELDFTQYLEVVTQSLANPLVGGSTQCTDTISSAVGSLTKLLSTSVRWCGCCVGVVSVVPRVPACWC